MNTAKKASGVAIATAAAALFLSGMSGVAVAAEGASADVHCYGINACKGKNSCKGQGFLSMSAEECAKKGGKTSEG
jgi:hypothetical protein